MYFVTFNLKLSLEPKLENEKYNGKYFADCELKTPDKKYPYESKEAEKLAEKLWKISEEITQSKFN